jgi:hypothetical protein
MKRIDKILILIMYLLSIILLFQGATNQLIFTGITMIIILLIHIEERL